MDLLSPQAHRARQNASSRHAIHEHRKDAMNSTPIKPDTLLDDLHPARFLKVTDLLHRWQVQSLIVEISRMTNEETTPSLNDIDPQTRKPRIVVQPVLYFKTKTGDEFPRGYLVSAKADIESLKAATGARTVGELTEKKIKIVIDHHRGRAVLRIDPQPVTE